MRQASLLQSFIPIIVLIGLLGLNVYFFEDDTLSGSNQTALIMGAAVASIISMVLGNNWKSILDAIVKNVSLTLPAIIILLLIGALAGTWLISGIVPSMIYYGLQIINPKIFLVACVIISAIVSLGTGSSWSTVATIGVAFMGIGRALGYSDGMIAGAIISGAYFGDKLSPMSDTTNLAPAMAGTDLFTHVRYMLYTTIPSIIIAIIIFFIMGFSVDLTNSSANVSEVLTELKANFYISPVLFIVPVLVIALIVKKVPPIPAIFIGFMLGAIFAIIFQPEIIERLSGIKDNYLKSSYITSTKAIYGEISIKTNNEIINELLSAGGMAGMLNTIWLILSAMFFSGAMASAGMLQKISASVLKVAKSQGSLVSTTVGSCVFLNVTASDQYLSIVVPGQMFKSAYKKQGLMPEVLSRSLEDSGTVTSVLVPWNTCGATQSKVLGVATGTYAPYAFFCIMSPLMSILMAYLNIKIRKRKV